ncbi:MAG TPA: multifunctional oxoglutarate decarboxylase/oxoglutarate dehydrogenase thiamine pyrophosphate-binding subunit/dihydrolipoyllysine-residue succinyltransferase subunit [Actinomycetota bacterium]|nr:multifunctional oxoglutarate decarboxylase/oxoglutarate dehydrogenase thiamine pyrophosphate-binding subunit/dihydrolipoyllysine-residue succinyltransferase subunit [Actinomycetota bacterium]
MDRQSEQETFGPNIWLVDEMYRRYQENPKAVSESWRDFFDGYEPAGTPKRAERSHEAPPRPEAQAPPPPPAPVEAREATPVPEDASPLRGVAARIAENMEASLGIPTATSVRTVPAKLLEENRRIINRYLAGKRGGKVSFTHLIGYAILRALEARPEMKASFAEIDGKPHVVQHKHVNFGLAVDVERKDGGRILYVPNIKDADELDFSGFWTAYEQVIRKVRANELAPEDFAGTTVTLTNPGTVGTNLSVPRLMPAQGLIVGTGAINYPIEYEAADPRALARIGVSKVLTVTSTYDHRVIQGAESGQFLATVHELLLGGDRFYDEIFASLKIPYKPVRWSRDRSPEGIAEVEKQSKVIQLINMYRVRGHLLAELNPIGWEILAHPELDLSYYGLTVWDLDRWFLTDGLPGGERQSLRGILDRLRDAYCRTTGIEYMHISEPDQKRWIQERVEAEVDQELPIEEKKHILERLNAAEAFERFLHSKYTGQKRFSLEGAESLIPMLDCLIEGAEQKGIIEVVMGMSHRGRLNVLANIVGKPLSEIFNEFEGNIPPETVQGSGDVKYHLGMTGRFTTRNGNSIGVVLASNPSHLEAVDPVVEGMARAKQDLLGDGAHERVLPVLLHGDAAFAGQGVVAETLNLSALPGYRTGGTVHIVVNNNIGFTTAPAAGRSSTYATDIAKMVQAPIVHVNGDDPEACVRAVRLALDFRNAFQKDVVIDLVCYRRYGHNEADEPAFTQPLMYSKIDERRSVRKLYTEALLNRGELSVEEAEQSLESFRERMQTSLREVKESAPPKPPRAVPPRPAGVLPAVDTRVDRERLERIHKVLTSFPPGFEPHPKLKKMIEKRASMLEDDAIDWASGEALSFGSLLLEGIHVRIAGQDTRRGTFSQRHSVLVDYRTGEEYTPLNDLGESAARFRAYDSLLSEYAAMGFEYGYSVANGDALVCWEAQFGDFVNGAQIVIDQFLVAGEDKWGQESGLVLLLPHGFEGQGPEHSSARLERFLTLSAEDNIQVVQPTTAAQYFHVLRRQMHRSVRKPLVVMTPKSLLRHPAARSATKDLTEGGFTEALDDPFVRDRDAIRRVLLCTGKIAYPLIEKRDADGAPAAIVRIEQLYPFPYEQVESIFTSYPNLEEIRWVQEEPENMGAWGFVDARLWDRVVDRWKLSHASRFESGSPAAGSALVHDQEHRELLERAFEGLRKPGGENHAGDAPPPPPTD